MSSILILADTYKFYHYIARTLGLTKKECKPAINKEDLHGYRGPVIWINHISSIDFSKWFTFTIPDKKDCLECPIKFKCITSTSNNELVRARDYCRILT